MNIESGKYYRTKAGFKVGPIVFGTGGATPLIYSENTVDGFMPMYTKDGEADFFCTVNPGVGANEPYNIVAEWR